MPSPRFPIPQGTLDMLILQILSLEPAHGYGIAQRLEQISRSVVQVNQGSLYPALHRLQQKGWLRAEWKQSETGREAKFTLRFDSVTMLRPMAKLLIFCGDGVLTTDRYFRERVDLL